MQPLTHTPRDPPGSTSPPRTSLKYGADEFSAPRVSRSWVRVRLRVMENVLIILSDEHSPRFMGCSGHPVVKTPHLDAIAAAGVRFSNAYTPSPICVPARASLATGRWVHQLGTWGSAEPYRGEQRSWAHIARAVGYTTASIGKLHYGAPTEDHGFDEEIVPMHVVNEVGWVQALDRSPAADFPEAYEFAADIGIGESSYVSYDRAITAEAVGWINRHGDDDEPWVLLVSFVSPHFPLTVPQKYWDQYGDAGGPEIGALDEDHPQVQQLARFFNYHDSFDDQLVRDGRRAYFGLCSFLDDQVGKVVNSLDATGQRDDTTIVYTSDHGDMAGNRGLWAKSYMYEDSCGVPLLIEGPGVPTDVVCSTPANLVDVHSTVVDLVGGADAGARGSSLLQLANSPDDPDRVTFSEYHDGGATTGFFMVRSGRWKYVYYVGDRPQLFDLAADPDELDDLGLSPEHATVRTNLERQLREIVDPEEVSARAFEDQAALLASFGGLDGIGDQLRFNHTPTPT